MDSIQTTLQKWIQDNKSFQQRHEALKQNVLSDPSVQAFLQKHPEITDVEIDKRLNKLYEYTTQSHECRDCPSLHACKNIVKGHTPNLLYEQGEIHLTYEKCPSLLDYEAKEKMQERIQSVHMPKEVLQASMANLYPDPDRIEATKAADTFLSQAKERLPEKGFYFTGPFGVGKTYLLGAIANELKKLGIHSMLIYMPEFVREIHASIQENTVQEKIAVFKEVDVLMLDDIGAETLSAWFRDEVLGAILQYRMMERLPVFFTSNYTMKELEQIISTTTRNGVEKLKAGRIMERIHQVSNEVKVGGINRRNER